MRRSGSEIFFGDGSEPGEVGINKFFSSLKIRLLRDGGLAIPRADVLAYIATKDVLAHAVAEIFGNRSTLFDGEIGNAF